MGYWYGQGALRTDEDRECCDVAGRSGEPQGRQLLTQQQRSQRLAVAHQVGDCSGGEQRGRGASGRVVSS
jgi:hypothetical protein